MTLSATLAEESAFLVLDERITSDGGNISLVAVEIDGEPWEGSDIDVAVTNANITLFSSVSAPANSTVSLLYEFEAPDNTGSHELNGELVMTTAAGANITASVEPTTLSVVENELAKYADEESGQVETSGLREAIADWRTDEIGTSLLREVIGAWRSGEVVVE